MPIMNIKPKTKPAAKAKTAAKPAAKRTSAKPATKTGARRAAAKPAAKSTTTAKRKPAAKKETTAKPVISEAVLNKHVKALEKGRTRLEKAQEEHDAASRGSHELAQAALSDGVPMKIVSETIGISRQYLYKGYKGTRATKESRTANGVNRKKTTTRATRTTTAKKAPAASSKTTTKSGGARPKIRVGAKK